MSLSDDDCRLASELEQRGLLPQEQIWALGRQALASGQSFQLVLESSQLVDAATLSSLRAAVIESERSTARLARPAWLKAESPAPADGSDPSDDEDGRGTTVMDSSLIHIPRPPALALSLIPTQANLQKPESRSDAPPASSDSSLIASPKPLQNSMASALDGSPSSPTQAGAGLLAPGQKLGPYEILSELGRGGMGAVYKARHQGLNRLCAIKVLVAGRDASSEVLDRFLAEARVAASLDDHPGIVRTLDSGSIEGRTFIAMELVEGTDFATLLKAGKVKARAGARVVADIARALAHAHARGIVHRDVKPQNILIDRASMARLADFGCAKAGEDGTTMTGAVVGTLNYMAPEQAEDSRRVDRLVDVYALGAILYHVLTGRPPHVGATATNILTSLATKEPPPPESLVKDVDRQLARIAMKALSREPKKRYKSAEALAEAIDSYRDGQPESTVDSPASSSNPLILGVLGALTLLALFFILRGASPRPEPEALRLEIIRPAQGAWIREPFVTLVARVNSPDAIVRLGKLSAKPDANGQIELLVEASPGENEFLLSLAREDPNSGPTSDPAETFRWTLRLDAQHPIIKLDAVPERTRESTVCLQGELVDEALARFQINSRDVPLDGHRFKSSMVLSMGDNLFRLSAIDAAGNSSPELVVKITRELPIPSDAKVAEPVVENKLPAGTAPPGPENKTEANPKPPSPDSKPTESPIVPETSQSTEPPEILDLNLKEGALIGACAMLEFSLRGAIKSLKINENAYPLEEGARRASAELRLSSGAAKIEIVVTDALGREARVLRQVEVDADAPELAFEEPEDKVLQDLLRGSPLNLLLRDKHPPALARWLEGSKDIPVKGGALRLDLPHAELLKGLTFELVDLAGNQSRIALLPPLPLLHDFRAWAGVKTPNAPQKLEIQALTAALAPDFEPLGAQVYGVERSRFLIISFRHKLSGMEFRLIPGGSYVMGADPKDPAAQSTERPAHTCRIKPFLLAPFEISNFDYDRLRDARDLKPGDTHSVDNISFEKTLRLFEALRKSGDRWLRLPTEAEWEFAARAGTKGPTFFTKNSEAYLASSTSQGNNGRIKRAEILKLRRTNPFGLFDMLSSVEEWVSDDWHESYDGAPNDGSSWGDGRKGLGVLRGGAVGGLTSGPNAWRCSARRSFDRKVGNSKSDRDQTFLIGMRVAGSLDEAIKKASSAP